MRKVFHTITFLLCACQPPADADSKTIPSSLSQADTLKIIPKPQPHPYWTDLARVLGGLRPMDTLYWKEIFYDTAWLNYTKRVNYLWENRKNTLYDSLKVWASRELQPYHEWKGNVFYPFSGADWPSIYYTYPHGSRYIFFGLEQEGDPHFLRLLHPTEIVHNLQGTYATLQDLLRLTFFKTKDMQVQLAHGKVRGLLPVFLALFARTGHVIYKVQHIYLKSGGEWDTLAEGTRKPPQSAWDEKITGLRFEV
ncbi:MAG: hypothetical protein RMJ66_04945, partial [Bacteroidia bacterium]|nr:hypothetical protein [Bacteroidia bacterium]MDW8134395.1 hypothetical protein [Bacteroidia bacterium]